MLPSSRQKTVIEPTPHEKGGTIDNMTYLLNPGLVCYVRKIIPGEAEWNEACYVHVHFDYPETGLADRTWLNANFEPLDCPNHPRPADLRQKLIDHCREQWQNQTQKGATQL